MSVLDYATPAPPRRTNWRWATWSSFLGVSWTWCIGMFLPVLLIRDYGFAGYLIFAIPNVIGAAAMGWVIRSPASSRAIVSNHHSRRFISIVTIAFHFYFIAWLVRSFWSPIAVPILLFGCISCFILVNLSKWSDRAISVFAFCFSLILICGFKENTPSPHLVVSSDPLALLALASVCIFGFALCPYLDLTFTAPDSGSIRSPNRGWPSAWGSASSSSQ